MWNTLTKPWQVAFEQAWESFICGSYPVGVVITDENDEIISRGRNRSYEKGILNPIIAHAETDAIQKLDVLKFPNVRSYTLYTTLEPCPMCMGALVMSNLRKLKIAARDGFGGAAYYCEKDPYFISKKVTVDFNPELETVQLVITAYFVLKSNNESTNRFLTSFEKDNPKAMETAKLLYAEKRLDRHIENKTPLGNIFDEIVSQFL
ncbi:MAG: nucleoside deaminase [Defluviitaleaceae bacterium]|nr:nucleoside deaminase [Defluviitaleaceae bacterium]